jgi:hypothetical protein
MVSSISVLRMVVLAAVLIAMLALLSVIWFASLAAGEAGESSMTYACLQFAGSGVPLRVMP